MSSRDRGGWRTGPGLPRFSGSSRRGRGGHWRPTSDRLSRWRESAMARLDLNALTLWITAAAQQQPTELASQLMQRADVSRATANKALRRLTGMGWLVRDGAVSRPSYRPG